MSLLQSVLLGLIQGLTEFLPVSSSGHLAIFKRGDRLAHPHQRTAGQREPRREVQHPRLGDPGQRHARLERPAGQNPFGERLAADGRAQQFAGRTPAGCPHNADILALRYGKADVVNRFGNISAVAIIFFEMFHLYAQQEKSDE